jgi:hypothetical protein
MPHSPRWHDGRLWLLESGTGQLVLVDPATGRRQTVAALPGFARGLALVGPYAFVGLSKIRATSAMDGVPLAERREQLKCGVAVVDLRSSQSIALLEFQTAVEEIFDVQLLPGLRFPEVVGFQKESFHHTFIIPGEVPTAKQAPHRPGTAPAPPRRSVWALGVMSLPCIADQKEMSHETLPCRGRRPLHRGDCNHHRQYGSVRRRHRELHLQALVRHRRRHHHRLIRGDDRHRCGDDV